MQNIRQKSSEVSIGSINVKVSSVEFCACELYILHTKQSNVSLKR